MKWGKVGNQDQKSKSSIPSLPALCEEEGLVSTRFRGYFEHALDSKGRVQVPVPFRSLLKKESLVLTNYICDGYRCLEAYPESVWIKFENQLAKRSRFEPKLKTLENYYLSRAQVCPLDASGRINIPQSLLTYASLKKEVSFNASLHGFRVWDRAVWNVVFEEAEKRLLESPELFMELDL